MTAARERLSTPVREAAPAVRVDRDGARWVLPVRMGSWSSRLDLVWLLVWAVAETALLAALLRAAREDGGAAGSVPPFAALLAFFLLMSAAGLLLLWRVQWLLRGREILELLPGRVRFRRRGLWAGRARVIPVDRLRAVRAGRVQEHLVYPSWGRRFVGKAGGCVVLDLADGGRLVLGRGLGHEDARRVAEAVERHRTAGAAVRAA